MSNPWWEVIVCEEAVWEDRKAVTSTYTNTKIICFCNIVGEEYLRPGSKVRWTSVFVHVVWLWIQASHMQFIG